MTGAAIKAVLWDIGNVIVRWDPRTLYTKIFPDPAQRDWFLSQVCTLDWHAAHDRGVTFAENRIPLIARFTQFEAEILAWETRWPEMFSGPIPETETAIAALAARGVDQFGVTNMSQEMVTLELSDGNSSALFTIPENATFKYVVMPMRI